MFFKNHSLKRPMVCMVLALGILALSTPFLIQFLINLKPVKARLTQALEKHSGIEIHPAAIKFILDPFPGICFLDVDLRFSNQLSLTIDRTEVGIDLSQLLQQKISAGQIDVYGPRLIYTPDGPGPAPRVQTLSSPGFQVPVEALIQKITAPLFALFPKSPNDLEISIKQAKSDFFPTMDARLRVSGNKNGMSFNARLQNLDYCHGQVPGFDILTRRMIKQLKADSLELNLKLTPPGILSGNIIVIRPQALMSSLPDSTLTARRLDLNLSLTKDLVTARLIPADIIRPKAGVGIEFTHRPKTKTTSLTFTGSDIDIAQARAVCLPLLGHIKVVTILFDILRAGRAEDIMVKFEAGTPKDLFGANTLKLDGSAASVRVKIPGIPLIVENVTGQAMLEKGILHVDAQNGEVRSTQIKNGILDVDLLNHPGEPFTGKFALKTDLSRLPATLMELLPGTRLASELARVSELKGQADGVLELDKPIGASKLGVRVVAQNINVSGRYDPIPLPLAVTQGDFTYDTDLITLKNIRGSIGASQIEGGHAEIILEPTPVLMVKQAQASLLTEEFMPWIKATPQVQALLFPVNKFSGLLNLEKIEIEGPMFVPDKWRFELKGEAQKIDLGFADLEFPIRDLSCRFKTNQDSLEVKNLKARVDDITWLGEEIAPDILAGIKMPLFIVEGEMGHRENKFFQARLNTPTGPVLSFTLAGKSWSDMRPTQIMIKHGVVTDATIIPNPAPDKPKLSFQGRLNTSTLEKLMVKGSSLYNKLTSVTKGTPMIVSTDDKSRIHINAQQMDLDAFLSGNQGSDKKQITNNGRPILAPKDLFLRSNSLVYRNKNFSRVDTRIIFGSEKTQILIDHADLCDLTAMGSVNLVYEKEKTLVTTNLDISSSREKNISNIFGCLFGSKSIIEGQCTFKGKLFAHDYSNLISRRQNGEISFQAKNGRIYKATLLSRVLSVLNIIGDTDIRQQGFGFKRITVKADVETSVIHIKNAYIDADDMAIIASGWVDPFNDRLNLTFLVAPFKTFDTIIQHIPVLNTILSGRLASFPAQASGKISDPSVIPLHPSAVGEGLITLFGDLLNAPIRLITGEKNNE